jgi:hypothetical protein
MSLESLISIFVVLFVVIDPIGLAPIFGALTRGGSVAYRRRMAVKAVLLATGILFLAGGLAALVISLTHPQGDPVGHAAGFAAWTTVHVIGIPLDGTNNTPSIPDTDGGLLDGDTTWDRAVGPMQFIPGTWALWGASATGAGDPAPHQIDDAALSAGRYLCANGRDLSTAEDWEAAILSYNRSPQYVADVLAYAHAYADASA